MNPNLRRTLVTIAEILGTLGVYLVASAAITWPAAGHISEVVIGGGELGGWLWRYAWHFQEAEALRTADLSFLERLSILVTLGRHPETGNILDVLFLSWPLSKVLDFPAHYNVKVLLILTLDGLCGYALARHFTAGRLAALAAGLVAVVNPLNIQDLNGSGLRQCLLWWVLLYPVFLDRAARRRRLVDLLAAGACAGMAAAWYWFYGLFAGVYTGLFMAWLLLTRQATVRGLLQWGIPVAVFGGALALPFVKPYLSGAEGNATLPEMSFFLAFPRYDTIASAPLRPETYAENVAASLHRTIRSSWAADYIVLPTSERTLPFTVVLVGLLPAVIRRRDLFWVFVFLFFYLGSLGPYLKVSTLRDASEVFKIGEDWVVRLPYTWLFRWIPGMSRLFAPYRLAAFVVVSSVVLLALGIAAVPSMRRRDRILGVLLGLGVMSATMVQKLYRFEVQDVPEGSFQPSRWRAPVKVSRIDVPEFYRQLDPNRMEGIIELPLGREQDLLCYYQVVHWHKVFGSWATSGALPPTMARSGGGEIGERLRYLVRQLPQNFPGTEILDKLSTTPGQVPVEDISPRAIGMLAVAGSFRYLVVHERGYFLIHPYHGPVLYRDAVQRLAAGLGIQPVEVIEHAWVDYPGNQYNVPDGPVYIPWSAEEVALPDQEMPRRLYMSIFDLSPLWVIAGEGEEWKEKPVPSPESQVKPPQPDLPTEPAPVGEAGAPPSPGMDNGVIDRATGSP